MTFYLTMNYYGGDIQCIEQACKEQGATLLAINGTAFDDLAEERRYGIWEGSANYLVKLESASKQEAQDRIHTTIHQRIAELWQHHEL